MKKKRIVIALGHHALGTTLPEQKIAVAKQPELWRDVSKTIIRQSLLMETVRRSA